MESLWNAATQLTAGRALVIVICAAFAVLAIGLIIASRKRLGQTKPITVAIVLSILAHIWLLTYAVVVPDSSPPGNPRGTQPPMAMAFGVPNVEPTMNANVDEPADSSDVVDSHEAAAWEQPVAFDDLLQATELADLLEEQPPATEPPELLEPAPLPPLASLAPSTISEATVEQLPQSSAIDDVASNQATVDAMDTAPLLPPDLASLPQPEENDFPTPIQEPSSNFPQPRLAAELAANQQSPILPPTMQLPEDAAQPAEYRLRQAPNRLQLVEAYGADADTEAAVERGLAWLAAAQAVDGSWISAMHGGGQETMALGEYRHGTGSKADTGISGLALLAFLSAGHTHRDGAHSAVVANGLNYLLLSQMPSGDLSGAKQVGHEPAVVYARMYCHSIAALALAEAYAMTKDPALKPAVVKAAQYSIRAQDVRSGGWRYRPGDSGDLSQFGWQAMFLRSVQRSGISIPLEAQQRMRQFLQACSAGERGGLARYLPKDGRPTATMTAEGLACRLLIDYPHSASAQQEALNMLMAHLPGTEPDNVYYWYYATLALFQLQDEHWRVWNQALKQRLIATQLPAEHPQAGSWNPDTLWGGYGGRVYSTAVSCLCLEVYYRYLPMYQHAQLARQNAAELNR